MVKIERSFPAPKSLAEEARKTNGRYDSQDVIDQLKKDFHNKSDNQESKIRQDQVRGCLFGGAVGDALGYPVEFLDEEEIFYKYGPEGIRQYHLDRTSGKALISDDTQMSLFTASGLLVGDTRGCMRGIRTWPRSYGRIR